MKNKNKPIEDLIKEYEEELCNFSNIDFLIKASRKYVDTMEDCQVRCLLHAMANELDKHNMRERLDKKPIKRVGQYTLEFYNKEDDMISRVISKDNYMDSLKCCEDIMNTNKDIDSFTIDMPRFNSKYNVWGTGSNEE